MCHHHEGRFDTASHHRYGCSCSCPATMTIEEEIRLLDEHKQLMQDQLGIIEKKIAALKSAKEA